MLTEGLTGVHVREMNLNERDRDAQEGIPERDAGMGVRPGVDKDEGNALFARSVDAFDERVFGVALKRRQGVAQFQGQLGGCVFDFGQSNPTVFVGLPSPQQVQVGAIDEQQFCQGRITPKAGHCGGAHASTAVSLLRAR